MLTLAQEQVDRLAQATFFRNLEARLSAVEGQTISLGADHRQELWSAAEEAAKHGIRTIGACLVLCQIYWELGLDCAERIPAMGMILADEGASEEEKIDALWAVRTALFAALKGA